MKIKMLLILTSTLVLQNIFCKISLENLTSWNLEYKIDYNKSQKINSQENKEIPFIFINQKNNSICVRINSNLQYLNLRTISYSELLQELRKNNNILFQFREETNSIQLKTFINNELKFESDAQILIKQNMNDNHKTSRKRKKMNTNSTPKDENPKEKRNLDDGIQPFVEEQKGSDIFTGENNLTHHQQEEKDPNSINNEKNEDSFEEIKISPEEGDKKLESSEEKNEEETKKTTNKKRKTSFLTLINGKKAFISGSILAVVFYASGKYYYKKIHAKQNSK